MVKKLLLLLFVCASLMGCISCEKGSRKEAVKKETTKEYVYEYRYFWLRQGMAVQGNGYVAQGLHDSVRPFLGAGISRIERAMGTMIKFVEVNDPAQADFFVGSVALQERGVLAFWDPSAKIICINTNAARKANLGVTLAHELGHFIGLKHSSDKNSVMFWRAGGSAIFTKKDRDNIRAILEGRKL